MSTTTWSAAKARPRASLAALPNCSTNHAWNFETPIFMYVQGCCAVRCGPTLDAAASRRPMCGSPQQLMSEGPKNARTRSADAFYAFAEENKQLFTAFARPRSLTPASA